MNNVEFLDKKINVPSNWDEFSKKHFSLIAQLLLVNMETTRLKSLLVVSILNLSKYIFNFAGRTYLVPTWHRLFKFLAFRQIALKRGFYISPEDIFQITQLLNFMYETKQVKGKDTVSIRSVYITKNHFPVIKRRLKKRYGPQSYLNNTCVAEYITAESHYNEFINSGDAKDLNLLCAALYRKKKPFFFITKHFTNSNDPRLPFSDAYEEDLRFWEKITLWQRFAIFLFFEGVRNTFIRYDFEEVYQQTEETDSEEPSQNSWHPIIATLAENVTLIDSVLKTNIHNFLFDLKKKIIDMRKTKTR